MRFFFCLLQQDKFHTNVNRARRQAGVSTLSSSCQVADESAIHLFRDCSFVKEVWSCCFALRGPTTDFFSLNMADCLLANCSHARQSAVMETWALKFVLTLWCIWKRRNNMIFQAVLESTSKVWSRACRLSRE